MNDPSIYMHYYNLKLRGLKWCSSISRGCVLWLVVYVSGFLGGLQILLVL